MFRESIINILEYCWPMLLIFTVIIVSTRIVDIISNKKKIVFYKEILGYTFIIYILCLYYVVTFQDVSWATSNFTLFKEIFRYEIGTKLFFKNVIGNMIMFVPFGFFISYFLKISKLRYIMFISLLTSITIEITQLCIGRVLDIDDIILNIIGALIGYFLLVVLNKVKCKLPKILQKTYIYNILVVVLILLSMIYLGGIYV